MKRGRSEEDLGAAEPEGSIKKKKNEGVLEIGEVVKSDVIENQEKESRLAYGSRREGVRL